MDYMFDSVGHNNQVFTLNLGNKFSVESLINYENVFVEGAFLNPSFKPKATVKTQAEKDAILSKFPHIDVTIVS
jgi:hypothetical protein